MTNALALIVLLATTQAPAPKAEDSVIVRVERISGGVFSDGKIQVSQCFEFPGDAKVVDPIETEIREDGTNSFNVSESVQSVWVRIYLLKLRAYTSTRCTSREDGKWPNPLVIKVEDKDI